MSQHGDKVNNVNSTDCGGSFFLHPTALQSADEPVVHSATAVFAAAIQGSCLHVRMFAQMGS